MKPTVHDSYSLYDLPVKGDDRGSLVALEYPSTEIPFPIKRVYYIYGTQTDVIRGQHAHKSLEQVLICVSGRCTVLLHDGATEVSVPLTRPNRALHLRPGLWRNLLEFSQDCVLLVLASQEYQESDYIRTFEGFLAYKNEARTSE